MRWPLIQFQISDTKIDTHTLRKRLLLFEQTWTFFQSQFQTCCMTTTVKNFITKSRQFISAFNRQISCVKKKQVLFTNYLLNKDRSWDQKIPYIAEFSSTTNDFPLSNTFVHSAQQHHKNALIFCYISARQRQRTWH